MTAVSIVPGMNIAMAGSARKQPPPLRPAGGRRVGPGSLRRPAPCSRGTQASEGGLAAQAMFACVPLRRLRSLPTRRPPGGLRSRHEKPARGWTNRPPRRVLKDTGHGTRRGTLMKKHSQTKRPVISGPLDYAYGLRARHRNGAPLRPTRLSLELEEVVAIGPWPACGRNDLQGQFRTQVSLGAISADSWSDCVKGDIR